MTIDRDAGYWEVHCDFCPHADSWDTDSFPSFHAVWMELRGLGWEAELQKDGTWLHRCPSCGEGDIQAALDMFKPKGRRK